MDFTKIARTAKVPSIAGSMAKNPDWVKADFDAFREKAKKYCPVIDCKGDAVEGHKMIATVSCQADDIEYIFVIDIFNRCIASKKISQPGEKLEFEVTPDVKGMLACCTSRLEGAWKSQPYMQKRYLGSTEYHWEAAMSHEKGACHTAPEKAAQWYPQNDRHPEICRKIIDLPPMKILYLHGHSNNKEIAERQIEGMRRYIPSYGLTIDILPANVKLTQKEHFASVIDYSPHLVELGLSGAKGYELEGYGHIEAPATDPNDPTCQVNKEGVKWAKMSHASMQNAVEKLKEKILMEDGYDVILGFSQGGEVLQQLINHLPEINTKVKTKVRMISMFGARIYHKKYGPVTAKFAPKEMKAFVVMGRNDSEDAKDATRDTDNLWDLNEFKKTYEACGIEVKTDHHEGGHEMPTAKMNTAKNLFNDLYEFAVRDHRAEIEAQENAANNAANVN